MNHIKAVLRLLAYIAAFSVLTAASCGEWEDYLSSPYHDFRWDWLVRDGHLAYGKGNYKEALTNYQDAIKKGCKDPLMLFRMGYSYRALRRSKEAAGFFATSTEGLVKAYPKHQYNWFSRYYLAEIFVERGLLDRAKQQLDEAIKLNPQFEQAFLLYGNLHHRRGELALAAEKYLRASEINPKSLQAWRNLGASYDAAGNYEKALSAYSTAKSLSPGDPKILLALASIHSKTNKPQEAMKEYEEVLKLQPETAAVEREQVERALVGLGNAAWQLGQNEKAVEHYQKALALNLRNYEALLGLGLVMLKTDEWGKAEENLRKALEVKPDSKEAHYNLGVLYQSKGDFDQAIKEFVRAIEIDPEDETCYYNVGLSFIKAKLYDQAKTWLNKAVEKFGKDSKWSKADLKLLELIDRIEKGKEAELEKELEKALKEEETKTTK